MGSIVDVVAREILDSRATRPEADVCSSLA
jgi:hypothetical protein